MDHGAGQRPGSGGHVDTDAAHRPATEFHADGRPVTYYLRLLEDLLLVAADVFDGMADGGFEGRVDVPGGLLHPLSRDAKLFRGKGYPVKPLGVLAEGLVAAAAYGGDDLADDVAGGAGLGLQHVELRERPDLTSDPVDGFVFAVICPQLRHDRSFSWSVSVTGHCSRARGGLPERVWAGAVEQGCRRGTDALAYASGLFGGFCAACLAAWSKFNLPVAVNYRGHPGTGVRLTPNLNANCSRPSLAGCRCTTRCTRRRGRSGWRRARAADWRRGGLRRW